MFCGKGFCFDLTKKTYVMGILNITPDSFFDGGEYTAPEIALAHAIKMQDEGADILDIGAMSTKPNSQKISHEEEIKRLEPVLDLVLQKISIPISIDTIYPETASYCLLRGVSIINDVSGMFRADMARLIKKHNAAWIITHTNALPAENFVEYKEGIINNIKSFFVDFIKNSESFSIPRSNICLDPGFGFAKDTAQNMEILKNLHELKIEGCALLAGLSAKRFIGDVTGQKQAKDRLFGSLAADIAAVYEGADILRVHSVKEHVDGLKIIDALLR